LLRALPDEPAQTAEQTTPRVAAKALVTVRQNRYSVPVGLVGLRVAATIGARQITISHDGRPVACHDRLVGRFGTSAQLDHYLELLARKPAALIASIAVAQQRERGAWPDCFDELWAALTERYGPSEAARQISLLRSASRSAVVSRPRSLRVRTSWASRRRRFRGRVTCACGRMLPPRTSRNMSSSLPWSGFVT
jgi:hypothetical protein